MLWSATPCRRASLTYLSHTVSAGTVHDPATGRWTIGSALAGPTTSVTLTITVRVAAEGVNTNIAEVIRSFETDPTSTPGNGNLAEDDIASACISVPFNICESERIELSAPASYTSGVEWFGTINGVTTSIATTPTFSTSLSGSYSFTAVGQFGCTAGNCCPVIINVDPRPTPVIVTSFTVIVNQPPVQAPIVVLCGPVGSAAYSFVVSPTTTGSSTGYFITVGTTAETGPFTCGIPRTIGGNTGNVNVTLRDATSGCAITLPVTPPTNCPTCPPKAYVPIAVTRIR